MKKTHIKKIKNKKKQIIAGLTALAQETLEELNIAVNNSCNKPNARTIHATINKEDFYEKVRDLIEDKNLPYFPKETKKFLNLKYKALTDAG